MTPLPDRERLTRWMAETALDMALPPGDAEDWTCLLDALGPRRVLATSPSGLDVCDRALLRALHDALGRRLQGHEADALLLVAPVPAAHVEDALCELVAHPSYWVRQHAAALLALGPRPDVARWLRPLLDDPDNDVRHAAVRGLARHATPDALAALASMPWDADESVDGARIEVLSAHWEAVGRHWGLVPDGGARGLLEAGRTAASGQLDDLSGWLEHGSEPLRHAAGVVVASMPVVAAQLAERVVALLRQAPGVDSHRGALEALVAAGDVGIELAMEMLGSEAWAVRQAGARVLGQAGPSAAEAESLLVAALDDADADVQREAAVALLALGRRADEVRARVVVAGSRAWLEHAARRGLSVGPLDPLLGRGAPSADLLAVAMRSGDERVRVVACLLLARARPDIMGPLLEALAVDEARRVPLAVRRGAAAAMMLCGRVPAAAPVRVRLLLEVPDEGAWAPRAVESEHLSSLAVVAVHDGDGAIRASAWATILAQGEAASAYRPLAAWHAAHDPDPTVRRVTETVRRAGWNGPSTGQHLQRVLAPQAPTDAGRRARSLRTLWSRDAALGAATAKALRTDDDQRALVRAAAILRGRHATADEVPALCARALVELEDARWTVREAAADLLGALPPERVDAALRDELVEALEARALSDYDSDVQQAARRAAVALGAR